MEKLAKLRAQLAKIRDDAQAIVDAADADSDGIMSKDQQASFDALMEQKAGVEQAIKNAEQLAALDAGLGRQTSPDTPATRPAAGSAARSHPTIEEDPMRGFADAGEFGRAVFLAGARGGGIADERLQILGAPTNFHQEKGSSDGYMVPPAIRDEVWKLVLNDSESILPLFNPEPTDSNQVGVIADESTPWGSTGIQAAWEAEGNQFDASKLSTKLKQMQLHKLRAFVIATEEILEDAPMLTNRLTVGAAAAIRWKADQAIIEGDGVGKPKGWMSSNALVTVAKESGQSANTIVAANLFKMFAQLLLAGGRPFWLANQNTLPQLGTMTIGNQPVWFPSSQTIQGAPVGGTLLGLQLRFTEQAETLGTKGDLQLVNPAGYYAASKRGGIKFASSMHLYFDYDMQCFRWTFRLGGQPLLSAPVTANKGDNKSHFVTLATRS